MKEINKLIRDLMLDEYSVLELDKAVRETLAHPDVIKYMRDNESMIPCVLSQVSIYSDILIKKRIEMKTGMYILNRKYKNWE